MKQEEERLAADVAQRPAMISHPERLCSGAVTGSGLEWCGRPATLVAHGHPEVGDWFACCPEHAGGAAWVEPIVDWFARLYERLAADEAVARLSPEVHAGQVWRHEPQGLLYRVKERALGHEHPSDGSWVMTSSGSGHSIYMHAMDRARGVWTRIAQNRT